VLPAASIKRKHKDIVAEKKYPGIASMAISQQLDDVLKQTKSISQRLNIFHRTLRHFHHVKNYRYQGQTAKQCVLKDLRRLIKQQDPFIESMQKTSMICNDVATDRQNHIQAIETSRNTHIYDNISEYQTFVLETQGKE
jgi:uncharacterized protein with ATP-grasp and redox domains